MTGKDVAALDSPVGVSAVDMWTFCTLVVQRSQTSKKNPS